VISGCNNARIETVAELRQRSDSAEKTIVSLQCFRKQQQISVDISN
jgi:hypothetical protein